jgi:hypothetical protein
MPKGQLERVHLVCEDPDSDNHADALEEREEPHKKQICLDVVCPYYSSPPSTLVVEKRGGNDQAASCAPCDRHAECHIARTMVAVGKTFRLPA